MLHKYSIRLICFGHIVIILAIIDFLGLSYVIYNWKHVIYVMLLSYLVTCVTLYCSFYLDKKNYRKKRKEKDIKVKSTQVNFCNFWQETYYTENTESRETERDETKKLSTETEKRPIEHL